MAIGNYEELLPLVIRRKLRWFGHVTRSSGLSKVCLQGTVEGQRKRGRQKTRNTFKIEKNNQHSLTQNHIVHIA